MQQYLDLCRHVLEHGEKREDRTVNGNIYNFVLKINDLQFYGTLK